MGLSLADSIIWPRIALMPNFPALRPATLQITPGTVPVTPQLGYDGSTTTSTADLVASGDALALTFEGLTEAEARSIPDHQLAQRGKSFGFDSATLAASLTPAGFQWTYARPVSQDDIQAVVGSEFYRLTVEFVGVWIRRASTPSASARIELRTTAAKALPAGTPSASATLRLTTTPAGMATGTPSQSGLLLLRTTPANAISTPLNDSLYGSVILHLPLTSEAGFTDVSGRATSITPNNVSISTTAGKWNGSSAFFNGATATSWIGAALGEAINTSDYTIRFWFNAASVINNGLFEFNTVGDGSAASGLRAGLYYTTAVASTVQIQRDGASVQESLSTIANNTWYFFQQTRANNEVRTSIGTTAGGIISYDPITTSPGRNWPDNFSQGFIDIGLYAGLEYLVYGIRPFHGNIQDFQVTLAARPHVVPTGPLPIF